MYGANRSLLWLTRETLSVKLFFEKVTVLLKYVQFLKW